MKLNTHRLPRLWAGSALFETSVASVPDCVEEIQERDRQVA